MLTVHDIAVPSCMLPASVADNAFFAAGRVGEMGLCFFETAGCLAYDSRDLPAALGTLPLRWHVHLPVDLPWARGGVAAAHTAQAVWAKADYLRPRFAVLHAPEGTVSQQNRCLQEFFSAWSAPCPVLLENIQHCDFAQLSGTVLTNYAYCLDVGHLLAFAQQGILKRSEVLRNVRLLHWSAPGDGDRHLPLTALTEAQYATAREALRNIPRTAQHMVEVFDWAGIEASVPVLAQLLEDVWRV